VAVALVVGLLTLYSMTKIWNEAFWKPLTGEAAAPAAGPSRSLAWLVVPVVAMAAITLAIGLYAEPLAVVADRAAGELLLPEAYVQAVLSGAGR
jgi:multicomponent Na+:H+ antiporter subunit D